MHIPSLSGKLSLRIKLAIPFVGIAALPLILVTIITIQNLQQVQQEQSANLSRLAAQEAAEEIEGFIELQLEVLKNIGTVHPEFANNPIIRDILLERFLHRSGAFLDIALIDGAGKEIARKNIIEVITPESLRDVSDTQAFLQISRQGSYVGPFLLSRGRPLFVLGREIRGVDGTVQGAIIAQVDARTLQDVVTKLSMQEENIHTYIVNREGRVIAHPDISEVLAERNLSSLSLVKQFMNSAQAPEITQTYENAQGDTVLGTGILFNESGSLSMAEQWVIIVEQSTSVALAPVRDIRQFSLVVLGFVLLLSLVGAILIANSFSRPIRQLQKGVQQIGLGNLDYALHIQTNDELEELAHDFNKMRLRLKEIRTREENLLQIKSEFVSIVAHQLRTPLSAIKWAIALFAETKAKLSKPQKELLEKMEGSNERMIHLVNDLLDAARIEEGRFVYKRERASIETIIGNVIETVQHDVAQRNIAISFHQPKEKLPRVSVDTEAIKLVLQNLIENAIHYTLGKGSIEVSATRSGSNSILVSISDTGIGIAPEEKNRIFTKFFRGKTAVSMETEGSGLGLFIVKNVIEAHGGKIWFESTKGKGTTFHFTIPLQ